MTNFDEAERGALLERLWNRLEPLPAERVALTAVFHRGEAGLDLRYASLLVGPER